MTEFIWIPWNIDKVQNHSLSTDEVEFAWHHGTHAYEGEHLGHGAYYKTTGSCPSGRMIQIIWRYNEDIDGESKVFVITAY